MLVDRIGIATTLLVISLAGACHAAPAAAENWRSLFDGKTLSGWERAGGNAQYRVEKGEIVGTLTDTSPLNTWLVTQRSYGDFIVELEIKLDDDRGNSGVLVRAHVDPYSGAAYGQQVEADPSERAWTGGIYDEERRGWLYQLQLNEPARRAYKKNDYNRLRIECIGHETRTWVNDIPTAYVVDDVDTDGFIGLQLHTAYDKSWIGGHVRFRNIRIQTGNLQPRPMAPGVYALNLLPNTLTDYERREGYRLLFDGVTSAGWKGARLDGFPATGWRIAGGALSVEAADGKEGANGGDLASEQTYQAFDLSFEFRFTDGAEGGVKYLVPSAAPQAAAVPALEYRIADDAQPEATQRDRDVRLSVASLLGLLPAQKQPDFVYPAKTWNRGRIVVSRDGTVAHYLNGMRVLEYDRNSAAFRQLLTASGLQGIEGSGQNAGGHILLEEHGRPVSFRSIKLKPL
ncbi:MAG: DUF1080 domain-containing protein [Pseudomonadota bacterium]